MTLGFILIGVGIAFLFISAVGAIRLPDFYTRAHAIGVVDTLGLLLVLGGLLLQHGLSIISAKLLLLLVFIYISNPTVTHVFVRAALKSNLKPWTQGGKND